MARLSNGGILPPMQPVVIGGPLRLLIAFLCFATALALAGLGFRLGWGIGWMAWIPAVFLLLSATALGTRRALHRTADGGLEIHDGWLFRRIYAFGLRSGELEILPAGGAWAVVLHFGEREIPLASWIRLATAERIAALLPELPRRAPRRPTGDR